MSLLLIKRKKDNSPINQCFDTRRLCDCCCCCHAHDEHVSQVAAIADDRHSFLILSLSLAVPHSLLLLVPHSSLITHSSHFHPSPTTRTYHHHSPQIMATYKEPGYEETFIPCPYNKNHRIAARRYQLHVHYCPDGQRIHGADGMIRCPYNSTHVFTKEQKKEHMDKCPDFRAALRSKVEGVQSQAWSAASVAAASNASVAGRSSGRQSAQSNQHQAPAQQQPPARPSESWDDEMDRKDRERDLIRDASAGATGGAPADPPVRHNDRIIMMNRFEVDWWHKHCFSEDGSLVKPLGSMGLGQLTDEERKQYYAMLKKATLVAQEKKRQAEREAAAAALVAGRATASTASGSEAGDPFSGDGVDWTSGAGVVRRGLTDFSDAPRPDPRVRRQ